MQGRQDEHEAVTLEQFTKQAEPFAALPAHSGISIVLSRGPRWPDACSKLARLGYQLRRAARP